MLLVVCCARSQTVLSNSATSGSVNQVYRITDKETEMLIKDPQAVTDAFFHELADSYTHIEQSRKLPFGNYLQVRAIKNKLEYQLIIRNNVSLKFVNDLRNFQFTLTDDLGNPITQATVTDARGKKIKFDSHNGLYKGHYPESGSYIKVAYNGISNYFTYDVDDNDDKRFRPAITKRITHIFSIKQIKKRLSKKSPLSKPSINSYRSFMVFSKPLYKPYDTVKFKAYILDANGENISTPKVNIVLDGPRGPRRIALLDSYRPGGYEHQFILSDSLGLRLDADYFIRLTDSIGNREELLTSGSFRYEDYELKSLSFNVRTDKNTHYPGEPITLFMKATDENELAVPDARVAIVARLQYVKAFYGDTVFVKDSLWTHNMILDPVGETKLVLPDSIFADAALSFSLNLRMLNSNNDTRVNNQYLDFDARKIKVTKEITAKLVKDSLSFSFMDLDEAQKQTGWLYKNAASGAIIDSQQVQLPLVIPVDYRAYDYHLLLNNGMDTTIALGNFTPDIHPVAVQKENQLHLAVVNPHKLSFWYTAFSGDKVLLKGYTSRLDTIVKQSGEQAAHFRINYFWDDEEQSEEVSAFYNANKLDIKLLAPDMVYPGQKVNMKVRVLDAKESPLPDVDVTAYAHTSKFNSAAPHIPRFGKLFYQRKTKPFGFKSDELYANSSIALNWQKWARQLALDTIAYYRFTHPNQLYITMESARDSITQFAPFVMRDGNFEAVNIIYVDEVPVFYYNAQQLQHYAFAIKPGVHSIRLRTPDYEVWIKEMFFREGVKTTFSVEADIANRQVHVVKRKPVLDDLEAARLNRYMIKVMDNFEGAKSFVHDDSVKLWLNPPPLLGSGGHDRLVGPLRSSLLYFESPVVNMAFFKEAGYTYTFLPGLIKQKSYRDLYAFDTSLSSKHALAENYQQQVLRNKDYDSIWNEFLNLRSRTTQLYQGKIDFDTIAGRLQYAIDTAFTNRFPYVKNILISNPAKPHQLLILNGNNNAIQNLPAGKYDIMFLLQDNRYMKATAIEVRPGGINYYSWKSLTINSADKFSMQLDANIKSEKHLRNYAVQVPKETISLFNSKDFDFSQFRNTMTGRVIDASTKLPIANASVIIDGFAAGAFTNEKGLFKINVPQKGRLEISMVGYSRITIKTINGNMGDIELSVDQSQLEEVVVIGYGTTKKKMLTGSVASVSSNELSDTPIADVADLMQGKVAGVMIRGSGSINGNQKPLLIVDGIPFDGDINSLKPNDIETMNVIKSADATAIYGARAANGVVIIKTKKGSTIVNEAGAPEPGAQRMRTRFSDEGFWQPRLVTDEKGEASFAVTFPDDITSWKTRVIAINGNQQSGYLETTIKSFKTLSANFTSPLFAIDGDSMNVIGKLMNYTPIPERVNRVFRFSGTELRNDSINVTNAHIDTLMVKVNGTDSLNFEYTLQQSNGYFDGEQRKVPVYATGVKETEGRFFYLERDTTVQYTFDKTKGPGIVRAEASVFPVLLDEMRHLRDYEYLCNEQLASKLKSLLLEKKLRNYLKEPFKYEKHILDVIKRLNANKSIQNLWGWWQGTAEESWISLHVVESLLMAQEQGYKIQLNKDILYRYLLGKIADAGARADINMIRLLQVVDRNHSIKDWIILKEADSLYKKRQKSLYEWMQIAQIKQMAGIPVTMDSLIKYKKATLFGGLYWGEERYHFWNNSIQNTLMAYRIFKAGGGHEKELAGIRQYFLEQRRNGQWRNTYESSLILETILPDLLKEGEKPKSASAQVNGALIHQFPFEQQYPAGEKVVISKQGNMPLYLTTYQQFQNRQPEKFSKDFEVKSYFMQNDFEVKELKGGKTTILRVEVIARADAEYVMIEVPIPAGCSYENKRQSFWGVETHREYFKNKTAIFCTKLGQGKYTFDIELMPRYSGIYNLNPAKAEMMYFPVFYGREGMKKVAIK
ncbi:alpha-2-macroglobulin family protein [Niabella yanshanensis]|uniref:Alpha-2-macroglobulin family protein n=1 Tax=Niabella yanshanensis TaxID=577386 RepID=A0ABZ0W268_9BACT|nr:alpha-2-macroglobulin family protein [Niabella yanshanensis]WQD36644.1 alpha-2-macroglobulin family protein [Niabella yanshanensis]